MCFRHEQDRRDHAKQTKVEQRRTAVDRWTRQLVRTQAVATLIAAREKRDSERASQFRAATKAWAEGLKLWLTGDLPAAVSHSESRIHRQMFAALRMLRSGSLRSPTMGDNDDRLMSLIARMVVDSVKITDADDARDDEFPNNDIWLDLTIGVKFTRPATWLTDRLVQRDRWIRETVGSWCAPVVPIILGYAGQYTVAEVTHGWYRLVPRKDLLLNSFFRDTDHVLTRAIPTGLEISAHHDVHDTKDDDRVRNNVLTIRVINEVEYVVNGQSRGVHIEGGPTILHLSRHRPDPGRNCYEEWYWRRDLDTVYVDDVRHAWIGSWATPHEWLALAFCALWAVETRHRAAGFLGLSSTLSVQSDFWTQAALHAVVPDADQSHTRDDDNHDNEDDDTTYH